MLGVFAPRVKAHACCRLAFPIGSHLCGGQQRPGKGAGVCGGAAEDGERGGGTPAVVVGLALGTKSCPQIGAPWPWGSKVRLQQSGAIAKGKTSREDSGVLHAGEHAVLSCCSIPVGGAGLGGHRAPWTRRERFAGRKLLRFRMMPSLALDF